MTEELNQHGYTEAEWERITVLLYDLSQAYLNGKFGGWEEIVAELGKMIDVKKSRKLLESLRNLQEKFPKTILETEPKRDFNLKLPDLNERVRLRKLDALGLPKELAQRIINEVFKK